MSLYKTILVPTDFSKYADNAIRYAQALAKGNGGRIHFAHIIDQKILDLASVEGAYVATGDAHATMEAMQKHAEKKMGQLVTRAKAFGLDAESHICTGKPVDELIRVGGEVGADLIVIATHGRSGFDRVVLGSTCERLIRQSSIPVMSVKHPEQEVADPDSGSLRVDRILCPCDFSEFSRKAVPYAVELCKQFDATLVLTHVVDTWLDYPEFIPSAELQNSPQLAERARESLQKIAGEISGVKTEVRVESGIPHRVLSDMIDGEAIDLIVMMTHGRAGVAHFLLGSVAEKVARLSNCPVLTIRPE